MDDTSDVDEMFATLDGVLNVIFSRICARHEELRKENEVMKNALTHSNSNLHQYQSN